MKKSVIFFLVLSLLISAMPVLAYDVRIIECNAFDNPLFDVICEITDVESSSGELVGEYSDWYYDDEHSYDYDVKVYADGTRVKETVIIDGERVDNLAGLEYCSRATSGYPAYDNDVQDNEYTCRESLENGDVNIYKVTVNGDQLEKEHIFVEKTEILPVQYGDYTYDTLCYLIYKVENGVVSNELYFGKHLSHGEYSDMAYYWEGYYDGLKITRDYPESESIRVFVDADGNYKYADGQLSQLSFSYNVGFFNETGWASDFETGELKAYYTDMRDCFNNIVYRFYSDENVTDESGLIYQKSEDIYIDGFFDSGYGVMHKYDFASSSEPTDYLIKLKSPAIITVMLDGNKIAFDQLPIIDNGRTLVPLRAIFDALGAEVEWDGATRTVTAKKDDVEIKLTIDKTTATKNGEAIELDVPAKIVGGRTMVPARFVADCFGVDVDWKGDIKQVVLTSK